MKEPYSPRWTLSRSFWSFVDHQDIERVFVFEQVFVFDPLSPIRKTRFLDTFIHLLIDINTNPSRTPITVVWDKNLPGFDSTRDVLHFKASLTCRQTFHSRTAP